MDKKGSKSNQSWSTMAGQTGYDVRNEMSNQAGQQGLGMGSQLSNISQNESLIGTSMANKMGNQFGMEAGFFFEPGLEGNNMTQPMTQSMNLQMNQPINQQQMQLMNQGTNQQMNQQMNQSTQWSIPKFGAHEVMMVHEVLINHIDTINQFELYRPYVKDQSLMQILDNQLNHIFSGYQSIVNYLQHQGMGAAAPYRSPKAGNVKYGLRQPSPIEPNTNSIAMDDRDVASGMVGAAKASAILCTTAALECADHNLRTMMTDCAVSSINQAYEVFQYMNQRGMYQVPTLAEQTTQTMMNLYQTGNRPVFQ